VEKSEAERILKSIREEFEGIGLKKAAYRPDWILSNKVGALEHCHYLVGEIEELIRKNKLHDAERQIGFILGVLWATNYWTLEHINTLTSKK
jgi:hypothetical protein